VSMKKSNEPATFRFVAQCLNQLRNRMPQFDRWLPTFRNRFYRNFVTYLPN